MSAELNGTTEDQDFDEHFFQRIVEKNLDMTTVVGPGGQILYQAPAIERVLGYTPEQSVGSTVFEVIHSEDLEQAYGIIDRILTGVVREAEAELRFRHANGSYRYIHAVAQLAQEEPNPKIVMTSRDVTAQYLSAQMLANNNELLSRVFSVSQNLLSITVPETGEYIDVNESWCQVLDYTRDEVIGSTALALGVWGSTENRDTVMHKLQSEGQLRSFPATVYTRSGEVRNVLIDAQYLTVADEARIVMSCQDVTESRKVVVYPTS